MQRIDKTLKANIKKYRLEDKIRHQEILRSWEKVIADFLPTAAKKTMALKFERGVLRVASLSKEIAYEIYLYQKRLIEALNKLIGKQLVYQIICEV